ncbi:dihydropteroate synthase [Corynebacterium ulceribovis]|uniref:dihydropteroate synthase n=1 Tax=Corynebacterium ulceribovis TaxID=487732 RepID=UPI001FE049AD|nr:dihydropteroate synthase [Corynebacterium ulceribovis]
MRPINCAFQPSGVPAVMAIVNRTPDSFYDKGATWGIEAALARVDAAVTDGASVIDIGGVKAGPGPEVSATEEIDRVVPLIAAVHERYPDITISVDTWRAEVADVACQAGAGLVNDTWAGADPELVTVAGQHRAGYVCSHTGGVTPRTRPFRAHFDDVVAQVIAETSAAAERAVSLGVPENKILIDPTHDFGKNTFHGLELLRRLDELVATGWPVLMALSNKDFVGETVGRGVADRVPATLAATAYAAHHGVAMFRAHQVRETVDVCQMVGAIDQRIAPKSVIRGLQ